MLHSLLLALSPVALSPLGTPTVPIPQLTDTGGVIGTSGTFKLNGTTAGTPELLILGTSWIPGGLDLDVWGTLWVAPIATFPGNGTHQWTFPIPLDLSLLDQVIRAQALGYSVDPQTQLGAFVLSSSTSMPIKGVSPQAANYPQDPMNLTTCVTMTPNVPTGSPGIPAGVWQVSPPLPNGLLFDTATGTISGTPIETADWGSNYWVTCDNGYGGAGQTLHATVKSITAAPLTYSVQNPVYPAGVAIAPNLPSIPAGAFVAFQMIGGSLPTGLELNASTGAITGTPEFATAPMSATIQMIACDGLQAVSVVTIQVF
ncbi:MAG: hypothetical protein EPO68_06385 [Planctomycetota bacterium]|nr:MAG: hypothetical protein EPO68_06385 [Planctomycetota bacterium]